MTVGDRMKDWDIAPLVAYAFAVQPKTFHDIDSLYKPLFDNFLDKSSWRDSRLFTRDSAEVEIYAKKVLGILQYVDETKDKKVFVKLLAVARNHFEAYYKYALRQGKKSPMIKFMSHFNLRNKTHAEVMSALGMILFFIQSQNKLISLRDDESKLLYHAITARLDQYSHPIVSRLTKENREKVHNLFKMLQDKYGRIVSLNDFTSSPYYSGNRFFLFLEQISELDSLPLVSLQSHTYSESDLLEICGIYAMTVHPDLNVSEVDEQKLFLYFMIALMIRSYGRKYAKAKERMLDQIRRLDAMKDTPAVREELEKEKKKNWRLEKKIIEQEETIQKMRSDKAAQAANLAERIRAETQSLHSAMNTKQQTLNDMEIQKSRLHHEIRMLENKMTKLHDKINILKDQKSDLRNIIAGLSTNSSRHEIGVDQMKCKKVVIIGGHSAWLRKLQQICPDFVYIDSSKRNFDDSILKTADQIAICYLHMSHALYRKAIECARKYNIPVGYLKCVNEDLYFFK